MSKNLKENLESIGVDEITLNTLIEITPGAQEYRDEIVEFLGSIPAKDLKECRKTSGAPLVKIINELLES